MQITQEFFTVTTQVIDCVTLGVIPFSLITRLPVTFMIYAFETILSRAYKEFLVEIQFEYYLPQNFAQWQDKAHGSIRILQVKKEFPDMIINDLSIEDHIQLRRACWNYLERRALLLRPNVFDIYS